MTTGGSCAPGHRLDKLVQRRKQIRRASLGRESWTRRAICARADISGAANAGGGAIVRRRGVCEIQPAMAARPTRRGCPASGRRRRDRVPVRAVRRHAREAEREAGPGGQQLDGLLADGAGFAGFAAGDIGQTPDNPDLIAMPDVGTFTRLPWKPEIGWFACDATVEGEEWPYCPRTILRHQIERARDAGFEFKVGCELEYFLVRRTEDGGIEIADPLDTLEQPCYDIRALTRSFDFVCDVIRQRQLAGLGAVRHRPRGRERPVRAELRLRGRAHHLRPRCLLPLHGRGDGAGARPDRDLHAEAVRPPDRQRRATST